MIDFILKYIKPIMAVIIFTILVIFGAVVFDAITPIYLFLAAWFAIAITIKSKVTGME